MVGNRNLKPKNNFVKRSEDQNQQISSSVKHLQTLTCSSGAAKLKPVAALRSSECVFFVWTWRRFCWKQQVSGLDLPCMSEVTKKLRSNTQRQFTKVESCLLFQLGSEVFQCYPQLCSYIIHLLDVTTAGRPASTCVFDMLAGLAGM